MKILSVFTCFMLYCCNLQAQAAWLDSNIRILLPQASLPAGARKVEDFKIKLQGATQMESSYRRSLRAATQKAQRSGANLIFITSLKPPGTFRAGWELAGELYVADDVRQVTATLQRQKDSLLQTADAAARNEAILVCYRNYDKSNIKAHTLVNDSSIGSLRVGDVIITRIPANAETYVTAGKAQVHSVKITGKAGEALFVKIQVDVVQDNSLIVSTYGVGVSLPDANAQVTMTEPRLGWEEVQALLLQ